MDGRDALAGSRAVLVGGPQDGWEVGPKDWMTPEVHVSAPLVWVVDPGSEQPVWTGFLTGVYRAPVVLGHYSRDDQGRLVLTWRGWR